MTTSAEAQAPSGEKGMVSLKIWTTRTAAGFGAAICVLTLAASPCTALAQPVPAPVPVAPPPPPNALSEGVAAVVNDSIISTYDFRQRVRLLLITSGVQPTRENLPQIEQEALRSLVDEHLEVQEIKREEKEQKFKILADDNDVNREISRIAQGNRMTGEQLLKALATAGVGSTTLKDQIRAQVSWDRWIQGRFGGSRMKIGQDQINAVIRQLEAETAKPQYQIAEIFIDAARVGGEDQAISGAQQLVAQLQQARRLAPSRGSFPRPPPRPMAATPAGRMNQACSRKCARSSPRCAPGRCPSRSRCMMASTSSTSVTSAPDPARRWSP